MKLGLIGYPLGHSWSKPIHDFMIGSDYQMFELKPEELEGFMTKKDFDGLNVTIPYKQKVMKYLDEIDETAAKIGAVNTIVNHNGVLKGYNTDYLGFMEMLKRNHIDVQGKKTAVLGSGGASRAVAAALAILGADFDIVSRKAERENTILYETMYERSDDYQVIVNTTPLGLAPHPDDMPVNLSRFTKLEAVADIIANPLRTRLLFEAGCRGLKTAGGLEMLVAQAWHADLLYTGEQLDPQLITDCLAELYRDRRSIVLIGMPTAGKTTVSALLGEACGRDVIEMDDEIVEILGTSIKECFAEKGEDYFRWLEQEVAKDLRSGGRFVISCGGGVIKNPETMRFLSENSIVVWLKRGIEQLFATDSRPLSSNAEALRKLYEERRPLYELYSDVSADNTGDISDTVAEIIRKTGEREKRI